MSGACKFAGRCGGCTYYEISYAEELRLKEAALRETLGEYAEKLEGITPAPRVDGYRNKMELAFGDEGKDSPLALGIRKKRSMYEVATTENCILMPGDFELIAAYALDFFRGTGEAVFHRKRRTGTLRHLVLRRGEFTGELLVMLSSTSELAADLTPFVQGLRALPTRGAIVGILHAQTDAVSDTVKNDNVRVLWGRGFYREKLYAATPRELSFHVSAFSFFQTNSAGAQLLYDIVRDFAIGGNGESASPHKSDTQKPRRRTASRFTALDLYCGTGTIAQIIAPLFDRVVGIELVAEAVAAARANAQLNGINNCEFHTADLSRANEANAISYESVNKFDVIVVDPPRDGLAPKALAAVIALSPARIVYVACKPASLVRDLPTFIAAGYTLERAAAIDLFPRTPHIECIALLQRRERRLHE